MHVLVDNNGSNDCPGKSCPSRINDLAAFVAELCRFQAIGERGAPFLEGNGRRMRIGGLLVHSPQIHGYHTGQDKVGLASRGAWRVQAPQCGSTKNRNGETDLGLGGWECGKKS